MSGVTVHVIIISGFVYRNRVGLSDALTFKQKKGVKTMTLVQEATGIMERMPERTQQIVVDLLKVMYNGVSKTNTEKTDPPVFKRTGKSNFNLPADFDEHFDDMNDEIAAMFMGDVV